MRGRVQVHDGKRGGGRGALVSLRGHVGGASGVCSVACVTSLLASDCSGSSGFEAAGIGVCLGLFTLRLTARLVTHYHLRPAEQKGQKCEN